MTMKKTLVFCTACLMAISAISCTKDESTPVVDNGKYIDLGLPSGTKWKAQNEGIGYYTYTQAIDLFGNRLPNHDQFMELINKCVWTWSENGYNIVGPNGNSITLPAAGCQFLDGSVSSEGIGGYYWSSTPDSPNYAWNLIFNSEVKGLRYYDRRGGLSVRLVK